MAIQINRFRLALIHKISNPNRSFFEWLLVPFNRVDEDRRKEVGPDRACAEWLLRNGASVRWKSFDKYCSEYNLLPLPNNKNGLYIEAVDATDSAISSIGFEHFEGCRYVKEIKLVSCKYVGNKAIPLLSVLQETLTDLEIVNCKSVDDEGLQHLKKLKNLKYLKIAGLKFVREKSSIQEELIAALPKCKINFD